MPSSLIAYLEKLSGLALRNVLTNRNHCRSRHLPLESHVGKSVGDGIFGYGAIPIGHRGEEQAAAAD